MKGIKVAWAAVLLSFGTLCVVAGVYAPFNPSISKKEQVSESVACLLFGVPIAAWGGWIFRGLGREKQQVASDRLKAAFAKLLTEHQGQITALAFALETGLDGTAAKAYLDDRAKEFNANFDVDEEGNLTYRFHVSRLNPS